MEKTSPRQFKQRQHQHKHPRDRKQRYVMHSHNGKRKKKKKKEKKKKNGRDRYRTERSPYRGYYGDRRSPTRTEGADPPARERAPGHAKGPRAARQGDQPEGTAGTQSDRDPDRGLVAKHVQELPRTGRAGAQASPTQIAGTGKEEKHTPIRKKALDRKDGPLYAMVAAGDTKEDNSSVNLDGTPTLTRRTCPGEPQQLANGITSTVTRDWSRICT